MECRPVTRQSLTEAQVPAVHPAGRSFTDELRYGPDQVVTTAQIVRALQSLADEEFQLYARYSGLGGQPAASYQAIAQDMLLRTHIVSGRIRTIEDRLKRWIRYGFYGLAPRRLSVLLNEGITDPAQVHLHINRLICHNQLSREVFDELEACLVRNGHNSLIPGLTRRSLRLLRFINP